MPAGYLFWVQSLRGPTLQRYPIDSDSPPHPKEFLKKIEIDQNEMNVNLLILEKRYPYGEDDAWNISEEWSGSCAKLDVVAAANSRLLNSIVRQR